jgi:hypothetical protein
MIIYYHVVVVLVWLNTVVKQSGGISAPHAAATSPFHVVVDYLFAHNQCVSLLADTKSNKSM